MNKLSDFKINDTVIRINLDWEGKVVGFTKDRVRVDFGKNNMDFGGGKTPGLYWPESLKIKPNSVKSPEQELSELRNEKAAWEARAKAIWKEKPEPMPRTSKLVDSMGGCPDYVLLAALGDHGTTLSGKSKNFNQQSPLFAKN